MQQAWSNGDVKYAAIHEFGGARSKPHQIIPDKASARGRFAVGYGTMTYGCNGYCALAGVTPFSQTDNLWQFGGDIGARIPQAARCRGISTSRKFSSVTRLPRLASRRTIYTASRVGQSFTMATVGVSIPWFKLKIWAPEAPNQLLTVMGQSHLYGICGRRPFSIRFRDVHSAQPKLFALPCSGGG